MRRALSDWGSLRVFQSTALTAFFFVNCHGPRKPNTVYIKQREKKSGGNVFVYCATYR